MIARSTTPPQPIPFASGSAWHKPAARPFVDPLLDQSQSTGFATPQAREISARPAIAWAANAARLTPPCSPAPLRAQSAPPPTSQSASGSSSNGGNANSSSRPAVAPLPVRPAPKERPTRHALARYDGPHSLSVRSAASGRHYRFEHRGVTQVIDAMDIALMRRIEDITLL